MLIRLSQTPTTGSDVGWAKRSVPNERPQCVCWLFRPLTGPLGDKVLHRLLAVMGEKPVAAIYNLDRAKRLDLLASADEWRVMRKRRHQVVHEYMEDPTILADALRQMRAFVPAPLAGLERRDWA